MDIVRIIVLICILLIYPLLPGGVLFACVLRGKNETISRIFLYGCLLCGALFAGVSFFGVRLGVSFSVFSKIVLAIYIVLAVICLICVFKVKSYRERMKGMLQAMKQKPGKWQVVSLFAFLLVAVLYVIRPFPMQADFVTLDRVVTILDTGLLNGVNVMTAETVPVEGNWKEQICNLPVFYACLCNWSGISATQLLFSVIPFVVLLSAFLVVSLFADIFFQGKKDNVAVMWLLFAMVTICGNAAYMNTSYGLLHFPYEAKTIFSCIVLPLFFLALLMKKDLVLAILIVVNAVFLAGVKVAGTMVIFMLLAYALSMLISFLMERRAKAWK